MVMATGALIATAAGRTGRPAAEAGAAGDAPPAGQPSRPEATAQGGTGADQSPAAASVPARRTGTPTRRRTSTGRAGRTGTRTDADLIAALADVPREPDGTVPVHRAAAALKCGPDRARRLLREAGLLKPAAATNEPSATAAVAA
jgi:hypothetical protein